MPIGTSRCGLLRLLGVRRDRIESDVGEEDDRGARQHADGLSAGIGLAGDVVAEEC